MGPNDQGEGGVVHRRARGAGAAAHLWRQSYEYAHWGSTDVQVLDSIIIGMALPCDAAVGDAVGDAAVARWRSLEQSRARFVKEGW